MHNKNKNISPTPHDAFWKANLNDPQRAKKLIETNLSKDIVKHADFTTLENKSTEFIQHNLRSVVSDVLYSVKIKGKLAYIYFLWEHMSTPQELMAFRMLLYVVEIMKSHLAQGNDKLPLVIPCVIYHGKQSPYPYSDSIFDCFEDIELAKQHAFQSFELIDLTTKDDEQFSKLDPDLLFEYILKHSRDNLAECLIQLLSAHPEQAHYFLNAGKNLLNQVFFYIESRKNSNQHSIDQLIKAIDQSTQGEFMTYLEKLEHSAQQKGIQQGIEQGIEQGIARGVLESKKETAINLLKMGLSDDKIIEATGLNISTILTLKKSTKAVTKH